MTLYVVRTSETTLITHDGNVQLGFFHSTLEEFMKLQRADYVEVHWIPDPIAKRYKKISYQKHLKMMSYGKVDDPDSGTK